MNAYELYHVWSQFESMMESSLPGEKKIDMGREWLAALPPRLLCSTSEKSYDIIREAMIGRLNDLKENYGSAQTKAQDPQGQEQEQGSNGRPKPVRKAKQNP